MNWNVMQWDGGPGHYEVYYLSATDPASSTGLWIRYTMRAPLTGPAECHLWFMAMDAQGNRHARKETFPVERLVADSDPFRLEVAGAVLSDTGMRGTMGEGIEWDLSWSPSLPAAEHVHPVLRAARIAKTVLFLPHPDLEVSGTVSFAGRTLKLEGARGGQAHLWGSKHATRWAWLHCNDMHTHDGESVPGSFIDTASVFVPRLGREIGPNTPVVARVLGDDFRSTSPLRVVRNTSRFGLTSFHFEAVAGKRKLVCEVDAPRDSLVGVTYHDPDGDLAYCYNSEVASMRLAVMDKTARGRFGWVLRETLVADGTAHFEYAQREPVADLELHIA